MQKSVPGPGVAFSAAVERPGLKQINPFYRMRKTSILKANWYEKGIRQTCKKYAVKNQKWISISAEECK